MTTIEEDDDTPRLSGQALAALQEFISERNGSTTSPEKDEQQLDGDQHDSLQGSNVSHVSEDWRLSQFWYDQETCQVVAQELALLSRRLDSPIACISCPSLYVELKRSCNLEVHLYEYDRRFGKYGKDFTFYDYNSPEDVPEEHRHAFQVVVADPPYLSKECIEKTAQTMKLLAKDANSALLLLTGSVQLEHAHALLGARPSSFRPSHHNKLGNEFMLFTNYDPKERLGGWQKA